MEKMKKGPEDVYGGIDVAALKKATEDIKPDVFEQLKRSIADTFSDRHAPRPETWSALRKSLEATFNSGDTDSKVIQNFINHVEMGWTKGSGEDQSEIPLPFYMSSGGDSRSLYSIATFLKGAKLVDDVVMADIESQLKGKKILVLGDDTGSLSELLNAYGAESMGIEYDEVKVLIAKSGILSRSGKPQLQVIQGDISDIAKKESDLMKLIAENGPFDVIYSYAVLNYGSGIEKSLSVTPPGNYEEIELTVPLTDNCMNLLSKTGFILHEDVDFRPDSFGDYGETGRKVFIPKRSYRKLGARNR